MNVTNGQSGNLSALPAEHPPVAKGRVALLLVNLGTPDEPTASAVRRYLREFLSDKRVVDYPRAIWYPVLYGIILNTRPPKVSKLYESIWHEESGMSPLAHYTRIQTKELSSRFGGAVTVDYAMRYGNPSLVDKIDQLMAEGHDRISILPLYPQYSATTTGTVVDRVGEVLRDMPWQPSIRIVPPFYDDTSYIDALEESVRRTLPVGTERIILSYHGIPERYFRNGDPYHCQCQKTSRLLRERMGWDDNFAPIGFQSQFGPEKWLGPSTQTLVEEAAAQGLKKIAVVAPAFVSDCIETLEEIAIGLKETFEEHGGEEFVALPCLNGDAAFIDALSAIARRELGGWIEPFEAAQAAAE